MLEMMGSCPLTLSKMEYNMHPLNFAGPGLKSSMSIRCEKYSRPSSIIFHVTSLQNIAVNLFLSFATRLDNKMVHSWYRFW